MNWWIIVFVFVVAINISGVVAPGLLAFSSWRRIVKHLNKTEWNLVGGGGVTNFRNNYDDEKFRIVNPVSQIQKERNRYGKIRITYTTSTFQKAKKFFLNSSLLILTQRTLSSSRTRKIHAFIRQWIHNLWYKAEWNMGKTLVFIKYPTPR